MVQGPGGSSGETDAELTSATAKTPALLLTMMVEECRVMATLLGITAFLLLAGAQVLKKSGRLTDQLEYTLTGQSAIAMNTPLK